MFQFSRFAHLLQSIFNGLGFPIRKSRDQFIFANPRSLSQLIKSFIASESQGIPRVPFLTFFFTTCFCSGRNAFLDRCSSLLLKTNNCLYCCFLFLCLLRCFSSTGSRFYAIILQIIRLPHSEISGSIRICRSPELIAAYHVLHRLWEPRHPPCTLLYFLLRTPLLLGAVCFI